MSRGKALCNQRAWLITQDQTHAPWQPPPHFPKQRPGRRSACTAALTLCYAWLTQGQLSAALCLFLRSSVHLLRAAIFSASTGYRASDLKPVASDKSQTTELDRESQDAFCLVITMKL